jgi:putative transferase (TIGR04331 family)
MTRLATTALEAFWGAGGDVVHLGPWCVPRDPGAARLAPDPWNDPAKVHLARLEIEASFDELMPGVAEILDAEAGGAKRPERYWRILVGPWLLRFLHAVMDRQRRLEAALESDPSLTTILLHEDDFRAPQDTYDYQYMVVADHYNLALISDLARRVRPDFPAARLAPPPDPSASSALSGCIVDRAVRAVGPAAVGHSLFQNRRDNLALVAACGGRYLPFTANVPRPPATDIIRRRRLSAPRGLGALGALAAPLIFRHIPRLYLEGWSQASREIRANWRRFPSVLASSTGWIFNEALKFAGAEFSLEGAALVGAQHGGNYGTDLDMPSERLELTTPDFYSTWGWAEKRDLPDPGLSRRAAERTELRGADLLLASNDFHIYPYLLYSCPFGAAVGSFHDAFAALCGAAPSRLAGRTRVRLYPSDFGWSVRERVRARMPSVRFDRSPNLAAAAESARLVVFSYLGTAFLELLASGKPCLVYQAHAGARYRPEAEADIAALKAAGLYFDDPHAAMKHVDAVFDEPARWWDSPLTVAARRLWERKYAGCGENAIGAWSDALLALAEAGR